MKKKNLLLVVLLVVAAFLLTGCGGESPQENDDYQYVLDAAGEWVRLVRYTGTATEVVIPNTLAGKPVRELGMYIFRDAHEITALTIPASITKIEDPSFSDLPKLSSITVAEDNIGFAAVENVLFHKKMKTVYCYPQGREDDTYTLPESITTIGAKAFCRSQLKTIHLPGKVTKIFAGAFQDSSRLESVQFGAKVSQIYENAFSGCTALRDVTLPESVTSLGAGCFSGCTSLREITVPASVNVMDAGAFDGCIALEKAAILSEDIQRVSADTFRGCAALVSVTYQSDILGIADEAFSGCTSLKTFRLTESLTTLGRSAFAGCTSLEELFIPDTLVDIGAHALDGTPYQASLEGEFAVTGGGVLLEVRGTATEIMIPDGVKHISFTRSDVTSVTVPEGTEALNAGAFAHCAALHTVSLPASLKTIGADGFRACAALTGFMVPAGVQTIGEGCFVGCTGIENFSVADGNVTFLADQGVLYDNSRKYLVWYPSASKMTSYAVPYGVIYLTAHSVENAPNLESFDLSAAQDVQAIDEYVFAGCPRLKSVRFTENFSRFGAHAFENDAALSDFQLTATMTSFGDYAFAGCTGLADQELSSLLGKMGVHVFEGTTCTFTVHKLTLAEEYVKTWGLKSTVAN